jgi:hypothetical protein
MTIFFYVDGKKWSAINSDRSLISEATELSRSLRQKSWTKVTAEDENGKTYSVFNDEHQKGDCQ